ncbi:nuclear transport factor 2 family protein [Rhodohalobacter sp. SW132]|uniref:YybH family protein n=1 Tax=Rhodohalobacter sp. SW132 TaxID=2293433 RepID=UPI000E2805E6|nr:nuclear transport factor 2 family protein [Rhodohalobacter sp. SW132]REL24281.1 nuclear transport factor 2 family protein [Rhodohalobacter sp. SW132]
MVKSTLLFISLLVFTTSFSYKSSQNNEAPAEIHQTWDQFIEKWEANDAAACAAFYTENGMNIPPGFEISHGRNEIESFYRSLFDANHTSTYHHSILDLNVFGDQAVEYGEFTVEWEPIEGDNWTFHARSLTHWVKNENGEWKIEKFIFNTSS